MSFRKAVAVCLFFGCLTASTFGTTRVTGGGGGLFSTIRRAIVHVLDDIEIGWPKP